MPKYSIIVPVYNRPDEVFELLQSLCNQSFEDFEVLIIEDGSTQSAEQVTKEFSEQLNLSYYLKENEGQGFARNYGYTRATGEFLIVFDSDCLIPTHYLKAVDDFLLKHPEVDAFGGPDAALPNFTIIQRAINHTMTSFFTTGGIRGSKTRIGTYHPRSFNMGISRKVYQKTKGYLIPFMGEDMEFSTRIVKEGFKTVLIPEAYVYHKRRTDLYRFFKQLKYFGRARINLSRFHKGQVGVVHLFPTFFTLGLLISIILAGLDKTLGMLGLAIYASYLLLIFFESLIKTRSLFVSILTPLVALIQFMGYGYGLVYEWIRKLAGINPNTKYLELYK